MRLRENIAVDLVQQRGAVVAVETEGAIKLRCFG